MVLTLAVMVPMAFLTEAVISHLSSELQTTDVEIQNGVMARAWLDPKGMYRRALLSAPVDPICNAVTDLTLNTTGFDVQEVLEGERTQDPDAQLPLARFYVLKRKSPDLKPAAYVFRVEGSSGSQSEMLPWPQDSSRCSSGYKAPDNIRRISFCSVGHAGDVLVTSVNERRNSAWKWKWSDAREGPADRPCICLPGEPCFEAAA